MGIAEWIGRVGRLNQFLPKQHVAPPELISVESVESSFVICGAGLNVRFASFSDRISAVKESHR
jgi:hypothetical protein